MTREAMSLEPAVHHLSSGEYRLFVTDAGAGGSSFGPFALTRWTPDMTLQADAFALYVRDLDTGRYWSVGYQPVRRRPERYSVRSDSRCIEIARLDDEIETTLEVMIAPGDAVELRRLTISNRSSRHRRIDVTSYAEVVLNTARADAAHPAFSKLFVQTEFLAERQALLARRRPRSPEDAALWLVHLLAAADDAETVAGGRSAVGWETDRMRFLERGRTSACPRALDIDARLSGTTGNVLDPVVSLRRILAIPPGQSARVVAVLGAASSRESAEVIAERYETLSGAEEPFGAIADGRDASMIVQKDISAIFHTGGAPRYRPVAFAESPFPTTYLEPPKALVADNGIGGFSDDGSEYVIRLPPTVHGPARPPLPWTNVIANESTGFVVSESGAATTWSGNSRENRLTPWFNDPVSDPHGDALYLRDEDAGIFWSPTPGPAPAESEYEVRHGFGYTQWRLTSQELEQELITFVPRHDPIRITRLTLTNRSSRPRELSAFFYSHWVLGGHSWITAPDITTEIDAITGAVLATNPARRDFAHRVAFAALLSPAASGHPSVTADRAAFLGELGNIACPRALEADAPLDGRAGQLDDPCAAFRLPLLLAPGETAEIVALLGETDSAELARDLLTRYGDPDASDEALNEIRSFWRDLLGRVRITTPVAAVDLMVNGWLAYQNLSCRVWGRSAFYQSGGAFGFRDQLQDAAALIHLDPALTRAQILLHAAHQFLEGDVLHWWHPPGDMGMRTRFADDLLWLPYITAFYVAHTGDESVLDEEVPFVESAPLEPGQDEILVEPEGSVRRASVYEHCCLALDRSLTAGVHDLPLMGTGDWNDGMNRVGREGRGESVWLGFFLFEILDEFLPLCETRGDSQRASRYRAYRARLGRALNEGGWDGSWYRRAYYDDGTPLGSSENDECRIDTIAQAWAVISGAAPSDRAEQALDAMERELVDEQAGIIRLLTPAFDRTAHDPGYIKGYLPGVRENGGQYTHGALWGVRALAEAGRGERAARLLEMLSPVQRGGSPTAIAIYQTEPYVIAADVYGVAPHIGRGGWTWYTGSAGWMYRVALESILGVHVENGVRMRLQPCIPASWPGFGLSYRLPGGSEYDIVVHRVTKNGVTQATMDGRTLETDDGAVVIPLSNDGRRHSVEVLLAPDSAISYVSRLEAR